MMMRKSMSRSMRTSMSMSMSIHFRFNCISTLRRHISVRGWSSSPELGSQWRASRSPVPAHGGKQTTVSWMAGYSALLSDARAHMFF